MYLISYKYMHIFCLIFFKEIFTEKHQKMLQFHLCDVIKDLDLSDPAIMQSLCFSDERGRISAT